jgi:predicted DCC family thiol-disulfide oxidoreductase YuxK
VGESSQRRKGRLSEAAACDTFRGPPTESEIVTARVRLYLFTDGSCPVCRRFRAWIEARDTEGRIEVLDLNEPGLAERFPRLDLGMARQQLTVLDAAGEVHRGLTALRCLGQCLPGLRQVDWIYELPGVRILAGGLYKAVNRYRKGLCLGCGIIEEKG